MHLKTHADEMPALNLTSMIDVLFLLIIFFMVATRFEDAERDIAVKVPRVSAQAAASPADTKYCFFVATGDGGHVFATTLAEHQQNIGRYQK